RRVVADGPHVRHRPARTVCPPHHERRAEPMTVSLLLGLACGVGLWIVAVALKPRPVPLARAIANLHRPSDIGTGPAAGRALGLVTSMGAWTPRREQQLALAGISPQAWARDKLVGAGAGLALPLAVWAALTTLGLGLPPTVGLAALACGIA